MIVKVTVLSWLLYFIADTYVGCEVKLHVFPTSAKVWDAFPAPLIGLEVKNNKTAIILNSLKYLFQHIPNFPEHITYICQLTVEITSLSELSNLRVMTPTGDDKVCIINVFR